MSICMVSAHFHNVNQMLTSCLHEKLVSLIKEDVSQVSVLFCNVGCSFSTIER